MDVFEALAEAVAKLGSNFWLMASAMAAVGVVAMAVIQVIKDATPARRWFQRRRVAQWLKRGAAQWPEKPKHDQAHEDLVRLATANDAHAFHDLPVEQMCGQMNSALQITLEYPTKYRDLLFCAAQGADPADVNALLSPPKDAIEKSRKDMVPGERDKVDAYGAARSRVAHQLQRAVDGFQISCSFRWKLALQLISFLLCIIITWWAAAMAQIQAGGSTIVLLGLLAGFLAPVSRDLVATLGQFRRR